MLNTAVFVRYLSHREARIHIRECGCGSDEFNVGWQLPRKTALGILKAHGVDLSTS